MKRYFLGAADLATSTGFFLPLVVFVLVTFFTHLVGREDVVNTLLIFTLPAAIFSAYIHTYVRNKHIAHLDDYPSRTTMLLKWTSDGVRAGTKFWGKELVYPMKIPFIFKDEFKVETALSQRVGNVQISTKVTLTAHVLGGRNDDPLRGFNAQELYDNVVWAGYTSVETWLAAKFQEFATSLDSVQQAFEVYGAQGSLALTQALQEALTKEKFEWGLTNITRVEAQIYFNPQYAAAITYESEEK